jgi:hypothetical protein
LLLTAVAGIAGVTAALLVAVAPAGYAASGGYTQQATLVDRDSDPGAAGDSMGQSVALSADGSTMAVGTPDDSIGAQQQGSIAVFTRTGITWTQQATLVDTDADPGATFDALGYSVAISANGSTIIAGTPSDQVGANASQGSAAVFIRSGGTDPTGHPGRRPGR